MPTETSPRYLTINAGSSSVKFAVYEEKADHCHVVTDGKIDRIGLPGAVLMIKNGTDEEEYTRAVDAIDHSHAIDLLVGFLKEKDLVTGLAGIGHRIVFGAALTDHAAVTEELIAQLREAVSLAPEHLPQEIAFIEALKTHFPDLLQVACFDTVFHHALPRAATLVPLPLELERKGIRRYGFHGLSLEYVRTQLAQHKEGDLSKGRTIILHLGNGASVTAMKDGVSVDTSMGFTPLGGIPMGTRPGDLDPGIVLALPELLGVSLEEVREMFNRHSGLLGMSETSPHMRDLLDRESTDPRAHDAVEVFCHQVKKFVGAYAAVMGGLDTIVFTGGMGEKAPEIRARVLNGLEFLGLHCDEHANTQNNETISSSGSSVRVFVIPTNEEVVIVETVRRFSGIL